MRPFARVVFLRRTVTEMGGLDIVLDDGGHMSEDQIATFRVLYPLISEGGLFACEDVFTSYRPRYRGGFRRQGSFVEFAKSLVDDMHAWAEQSITETASSPEIAGSLIGIHFHEGVVFIEKLAQPERFRVSVGPHAACQ